MFNDLSVGDTVNVDLLGLERLTGRLETDELSGVSATRNHADDDFVARNDLILNGVVKIAECIPQLSNRHFQPLWPRRCPWASLMVDEIRMKDLVYDSEVAACEDLVKRSPSLESIRFSIRRPAPVYSSHQTARQRGEACRYRPSSRQPGPGFITGSPAQGS